MKEERKIYMYEAPPCDHWDSWIPLHDSGEFLRRIISQNPEQDFSFNNLIFQTYNLVWHLGSVEKLKKEDLRSLYIYCYFGINENNPFRLLEPCIAFKLDNNGTCYALSYEGFGDKLYAPHDYEEEWEKCEEII